MKTYLRDFFRPSAIFGLIRLRRELSQHPGKSPEDICKLLAITYSNAGIDLDAALQLDGEIPPLPISTSESFRCVISYLINQTNPPWLELLRRGRDAFVSVVNADVRACFDMAGALDPIPGIQVVNWLDDLVSEAYMHNERRRLERGREAEMLSYEHEKNLLSQYELPPAIEWVALNDNLAGFDIRSARFQNGVFCPSYIEVKSSQAYPPLIILTRHEWDVARRLETQYLFHIWHLPSRTMREVSVHAMAEHVPLDQGTGRWTSVEIVIP